MILRVGLHILFWSAILYWRASGDYLTKLPFERYVLQNALRLPAMMAATYFVIYFLLPKFIIKEKKYGLFTLLLGLTLWLTTEFDQFLMTSDFMWQALQPLTEKQFKIIMQLHPFRNSFFLLSIIGLASVIRFYKIYLAQEKKQNQLIQENLETQYTFLKAQVNPHFLFNALNNIYSMAVQKEQSDIALGIENLSGIMQYLTYQSNAKEVPLKKEIELLKNYIDIEQLRLSNTDEVTISFNVEGEIKDKMISPVLLLPLVENAFKHGVKIDEKCLVSIKLLVIENQLNFTIKNTLFDFGDKAINEKGIGLENVKKRLELRYAGRYSLQTKPIGGYFYTDLKVELVGKIK